MNHIVTEQPYRLPPVLAVKRAKALERRALRMQYVSKADHVPGFAPALERFRWYKTRELETLFGTDNRKFQRAALCGQLTCRKGSGTRADPLLICADSRLARYLNKRKIHFQWEH